MSTEGTQTNLFGDESEPVVFEQPLTERIRNCLRLEHIFSQISHGIAGDDIWSSRSAINGMIEVSDLLTRSDLKGELIKELERQTSVFAALKDNPGVDPTALEHTVGGIGTILARLKSVDCQPGAQLRNNELANQVRQRMTVPGGTCKFDLPGLHYWLSLDPAIRGAQLKDWKRDLEIIESAVDHILKILRQSTAPRRETATGGFYQQQMEPNVPCQIVRIILHKHQQVFPEISGGRHRFTVHFLQWEDTHARPTKTTEDIEFDLQCCGV